MELGRVTGQVVSTIKQPGFSGLKLLLVEIVDPASGNTAPQTPYVAVDLVGAGVGEVVLVARGSAARVSAGTQEVPTDAAVVAIVDSVIVEGSMTFSKSA
ncbi:MAG: EutN/CcmL family microcompartment protein [Sporichthyaceae bacterium]